MKSAAQVPPSTMARPGRLKYMPGLVADSATTMIRVSRPTAAPMTVDGFMDLAQGRCADAALDAGAFYPGRAAFNRRENGAKGR